MSVLAPSKINRQCIQGRGSLTVKPQRILWGILACALLLVSAACGQNTATQANHLTPAPQITADPSALHSIYLVTFTTSTTYTQAHELLKRLGLSTGEWDCIPRAERGVESVNAAAVLRLSTPPPSQDTPEFYARTHELIVGSWETPTPQQLAQLKSSPQVVSLKAIPLVSC
jgi:hypothetical protein